MVHWRFAWLIGLSVGCGGHTMPPSAPSSLLASASPNFARQTLAGGRYDTAEARGRVLVVKFFAKYCVPCQRTLPELQTLHTVRPDVVIIGVAEDEYSSDTREMVANFGLTFPVVMDVGNVLAGRFRVTTLPVTFVIDDAGLVRWVSDGSTTHDALTAAVDALR